MPRQLERHACRDQPQSCSAYVLRPSQGKRASNSEACPGGVLRAGRSRPSAGEPCAFPGFFFRALLWCLQVAVVPSIVALSPFFSLLCFLFVCLVCFASFCLVLFSPFVLTCVVIAPSCFLEKAPRGKRWSCALENSGRCGVHREARRLWPRHFLT